MDILVRHLAKVILNSLDNESSEIVFFLINEIIFQGTNTIVTLKLSQFYCNLNCSELLDHLNHFQ